MVGPRPKEAEENPEPDAVSSPTPNGSFDPADYILPADPETSTPYKLLIEINDPEDGDQPSLVYAVEIDNLDPRTFSYSTSSAIPCARIRMARKRGSYTS